MVYTPESAGQPRGYPEGDAAQEHGEPVQRYSRLAGCGSYAAPGPAHSGAFGPDPDGLWLARGRVLGAVLQQSQVGVGLCVTSLMLYFAYCCKLFGAEYVFTLQICASALCSF